MKSRCETNSDLRKANEHAAKRRQRLDGYRQRTMRRRQRRDQCRLLALLAAGGSFRAW